QVLINPALDLRPGKNVNQLFLDCYLKEPKDGLSPLASPLLTDSFKELPPAFVFVGERDGIRAHGEAYAAKLRDAGVRANVYCHYGQGHLGPAFAAASPAAEEALDVTIGFLRAALRPSR